MKIDDMRRRLTGPAAGRAVNGSRLLPLLGTLIAGVALAQAPTSEGATGAAAAPPPAAGTRAADNVRAVERCESSVAETLRKMRGKDADDVQFAPAQRSVAPAADEGDVGVKGGGRYRGRGGAGTSFTYGCTYNTRSGLTSAVVLREAGAAAAAARQDWQPDLSRVSPEACESAVAHLLTSKHPRVARIAMEPDTRRLQPGPDEHLLLLGQGALQRAPGMNAEPFSYTCELNPRTGQVLAVRTSV